MPHQVEYARHLKSGMARHGLDVTVTPDINIESDIHIVLGPHYAKERWLKHPRVILLDRAYYQPDPVYVSLGWMRPDGGRYWHAGENRQPPELPPLKQGNRTIFFVDYQGIVEVADTVRYHPADRASERPLGEDLESHDIAIGYNTTTLVHAALAGLKVVCKGKQNIMYEDNWHALLPYADWSHVEIASGEAWAFLKGLI